ncbi:DNA-binding protein YbiB [Ramlibacter solisilvae]|uniref:Glycosyl transferase n=1 Tax=Ramlibacter tataouinensis TaxID=94132 RepID=A0A127JPP6_9BURK|nr:DNA-binding protein YbiB [Ramlibacter tataouinensis]AMO21971.1 glycosyl transferase [Ramlibacter tataouinensis]
MAINHYIREIGRGKQGARPLTREQAADLFAQVLDGAVTDLEVGAFCLAMRIKGESADEMAGFLDATSARLARIPAAARPLVVLPSYNGARKLPLLTPLLALLVARAGLPVLIHGTRTEASRLSVSQVLEPLDILPLAQARGIAEGEVAYVSTELLCPGLKRLLDVRKVVGVRNSAHSLVKLMNPCEGPAVIVGSYTHAEYAESMAAVFERMGSTAMLLRGTEGEAVADARKLPRMDGFIQGRPTVLEEGQKGVTEVPGLPKDTDPLVTAAYIREVMSGTQPVPASIALQVEHILRLADAAASGEKQ